MKYIVPFADPFQEPSITGLNEVGFATTRSSRITESTALALKGFFRSVPLPSPADKKRLCEKFNLSEKVLTKWFQHQLYYMYRMHPEQFPTQGVYEICSSTLSTSTYTLCMPTNILSTVNNIQN